MKKKITIKGTKYDFKFLNVSAPILGQTDTNEKHIEIYLHDNENELNKTIVHELLHAYLFECGLVNYVDNEDLVVWFENIFFDLLKNFQNIIE